MKKSVKQELNKILKEHNWDSIDEASWYWISIYQKLSEDFIREFQDKVSWYLISQYQKLSEDFIREFKDKVKWISISISQKLSEDFIREFKDEIWWDYVSENQELSEGFIREFKDEIDIKLYKEVHQKKSYKQKLKEAKKYAKEHNLKIDDEYLYAFREHDKNGSGIFNKIVSYEKGKYYTDWHCDMRKEIENSFGYGIWPKGNTFVKVKISDWGVATNRENGKARIWGFEIVN